MKPEIGIIGFGRIGQVIARHAAGKATVLAADRRFRGKPARGAKRVGLARAASAPVVIVAVHVRQMPAVFRSMKTHIRPGAVICEVGSAKEVSAQWMKRILPAHCDLLGAHPLFGPATDGATLRGKSVILTPVRIRARHLSAAAAALRRSGLKVVLMTPTEHDRLMARTIFLTQLIGTILPSDIGHDLPVSTANVASLIRLRETASGESRFLIEDLYRHNRFAKQIPGDLQAAVRSVVRRLNPSR